MCVSSSASSSRTPGESREVTEVTEVTVAAAARRVPVVAVAGTTLDAEQLGQLRREVNVTSMKDTGGDFSVATELHQAGERVPTLLDGWDTLTFAALAQGVRAVVWGTASIVPEACVALHRLLIDEVDLAAARVLWARIWPLCQFLEGTSYSAAVKTGARQEGFAAGPVRAPLLELDDAAQTQLRTLVAEAAAGIPAAA